MMAKHHQVSDKKNHERLQPEKFKSGFKVNIKEVDCKDIANEEVKPTRDGFEDPEEKGEEWQ